MRACTIAVLLSATLLLLCADAFGNKEICVSEDGLHICVEMRGPCDLGHLAPRETSNMKMDMFYVSIWNKSSRRIKIAPRNFYSVTTEGQVLAMDRAFFDSIEYKTKLREKDLAPQERVSGFLFFPSCIGTIRSLVHGGSPYLEIQLF